MIGRIHFPKNQTYSPFLSIDHWKLLFFCYFSVMQLNASPTLANAASPALHKDHWQQRRYTFLSKNSMFGGELKDEVINEQGSDTEQR